MTPQQEDKMLIGFGRMAATHRAARNPAWWVQKPERTIGKGEYFAKLHRNGKQGEVMGPREGCFLRWEAENDADGMNQQRGRIRKEGRDSSRSQAGRTCPQVLLIGTSTAHLQHQEGEWSKGRGMCWEDGCLVLRTSSGCPQGLFSNYVQ